MAKYLIVLLAVPFAVYAATLRTSDTKIVGGSNAGRNEYIYQASLQQNYDGFKHFCGGVIIAPEWIVTSAKCVYTMLPSYFKVVVGSERLSVGGEIHSPIEIHVHPLYNPYSNRHDVALVKIDPIAFTSSVGPIKIETDAVQSNEELILTGWGSTAYPGTLPDQLQKITLQTIETEFCKLAFPLVINQQVCTLNKVGEGACLEDSGSPLVRDIGGDKKLVGILSYGAPCANGIPDVSARVSPYISWIKRKCNCI